MSKTALDILSATVSFLSDWAGLFGLVFAVWAFFTVRLLTILDQKESRYQLFNWLSSKESRRARFRSLYAKTLSKGLSKLDQLFGRKLLGFKAYGRCTQLSLIYSIFFFILGWSYGVSGRIGAFEILNDDIPIIYRLLGIGLFTLLLITITWYTYKKIRNVARAVGVVGAGVVVGIATLVLTSAVIGTGIKAGIIGLVGALVTGALVAGVGAGDFAFALAGFVPFILSVIGTLALSLVSRDSAVIYLFLFLLPFTNALLDWISWACSRLLGRFVEQMFMVQRSFYSLLLVAACDFALAIVFLFFLAALIPFVVSLVNSYLAWKGAVTLDLLKSGAMLKFLTFYLV
jgi:hypothetical protein